MFPTIQSKPILEQPEAVFSHPAVCYQTEETDTQDEAEYIFSSLSLGEIQMGEVQREFHRWGDIFFCGMCLQEKGKGTTHLHSKAMRDALQRAARVKHPASQHRATSEAQVLGQT